MSMFGGGVSGGNYGGTGPSLPFTLVYKDQDEGRRGGAVTDDPQMILNVPEAGLYKIEAAFIFKQNNRGFRMKWIKPAEITMNMIQSSPDSPPDAFMGGETSLGAASTLNSSLHWEGVFKASGPCSMPLHWNSYSASSNDADRTFLCAGSYIIITKLDPAE